MVFRDDRDALIARLESRVAALEAELAELRHAVEALEHPGPKMFEGGKTPPREVLPTLTFHINDPGGEREVTLSQPLIRIGRGPSSHLVLDDPEAAARHALIENRLDGVFVIDRGTAAGTQVNGKRVSTAQLTDGDRLRIGRTLIRVAVRLTVPETVAR